MHRLLIVLALLMVFGCITQPVSEQQTQPTNLSMLQFNRSITETAVHQQTNETVIVDPVNSTALAYAQNTSTYRYDGAGLRIIGYNKSKDTRRFEYEFVSRYSGFGNRSAYKLEKMETTHKLVIDIKEGDVTSAILDGIYDEKNHSWLDLAKIADLSPVDANRSEQIAIDFAKSTEEFRQNAKPDTNLSVSRGQLTDTSWVFVIRYATANPDVYGSHETYMTITVNRYVPIYHNRSLIDREWIDWYSDPTTDYTKLTKSIPDPKCPGGQLIGANLTYKFCYPPSATHNKPCSSTESCERGACIRTSMGEFGPPAKCIDYPFGCRYWIFKDKLPTKVCLD